MQYTITKQTHSAPLLLLSLVCCLLFFALLAGHIFWQARYQALETRLSEIQSLTKATLHQPGTGKYFTNENPPLSTGRNSDPAKPSTINQPTNAANIDYAGKEDNTKYTALPGYTTQDILAEMFEDDIFYDSQEINSTKGKQMLLDAIKGYISSDVEYRLDAILAMKEITQQPLTPEIAMNLFELLKNTEDNELQVEILETMEGSVDPRLVTELLPYLDDHEPQVSAHSFQLIVNMLNQLEIDSSLEQERDLVLDYISMYPERVLASGFLVNASD